MLKDLGLDDMSKQDKKVLRNMAIGLLVLIIGCAVVIPTYSVWQKGMAGKAELAQAEANRKIKIAEAK